MWLSSSFSGSVVILTTLMLWIVIQKLVFTFANIYFLKLDVEEDIYFELCDVRFSFFGVYTICRMLVQIHKIEFIDYLVCKTNSSWIGGWKACVCNFCCVRSFWHICKFAELPCNHIQCIICEHQFGILHVRLTNGLVIA